MDDIVDAMAAAAAVVYRRLTPGSQAYQAVPLVNGRVDEAWIDRRAMLAALRALAAQALPEGVRAAGLTALLDYAETEQLEFGPPKDIGERRRRELQLARIERESSEVFAAMLAALIEEAERDGR